MSSTTSTSSEDEKFHHHRHHNKSGKITLNSKQVNKSNSFSSSSHRRDSLKKQQILHQQQQQEVAAKEQQEQQESAKQTDISSMNEPDVDLILNNNVPIAADSSSIVTAEAVDEAVLNAANDSETELRRRKVLEWTVQAMDAVVEQTVENNGAKLTKNRAPTEEEEEEEMKESKRAEQAIFSDSILDKTDKSIVYDFMSSMQESNDDEEQQLMMPSKTKTRSSGIKSMSADELDVASSADGQLEESAARPHSTTAHVDDTGAASLTATGSETEYAGAKSDNEAFTQGTKLD